jgi:hypothetical protein
MLPLMFLSSAFIQPAFMPGWMQAIASRNPLNWEVQIGRDALAARTEPDTHPGRTVRMRERRVSLRRRPSVCLKPGAFPTGASDGR